MTVSELNAGQVKKRYALRTRLVGSVILSALCVVLSLFAFSCTTVEAAVPTKEEISGTYPGGTNGIAVWVKGGTVYVGGIACAYDPATATATFKNKLQYIRVQFTKDAKGKVSIHGEQYFYGNPKLKIAPESIRYNGNKLDKKKTGKDSKEKQDNDKNAPEKKTDEKQTDEEERGYYPDTDEEEHDDLPESVAGKVAAAVGTALGGGLLGGAAGAVGGAAGGVGGGTGGAAGSAGGYDGYSGSSNGRKNDGYGPEEGGYGSEEGGYGPEEGGYGPEEGGYGPEEGGYGPEEGGYGPEEGGYGPEEGGYGPEEGAYSTDADGQDDADTDYEDTGDDQGDTDADYEDTGDDQGDTDADNEDAGDDQGDAETDYEDASDDQGDADTDYEDAGDDQGDTDADYEDAGDDQGDAETDYEDASDDQGDADADDREDYGDDDNRGDYAADYDDSSDNYEDAGDNQDDTGADYEDAGDDQSDANTDSRDDFAADYEGTVADDSAKNDQSDADADYEDIGVDDNAGDDQADAAESEDEPETPDSAQDEPPADNRPVETIPDNLAVDDDGSIRVTVPTGQELVYTRNEDGTYNMPTQTETGEDLTYIDEDGNVHPVEPGMVSQEQVLADAQWYKDHEQEILADRAEEDARQQAEQDRLAAENAAWLEKERLRNSQLSRISIELQEELRQMEQQNVKDEFIEKMRWKYGHGDPSLSKEDLIDLMKREQIKNKIEGARHEQEAAKWDDRIVTAQEVKFVADQSVNAYSNLSGNRTFGNLYNAATNYGETTMDAIVFKKDIKKALGKATIDTTLDIGANYAEGKGFHITGNAAAAGAKQVNDNLYNGRDTWEGTTEAMAWGAGMGAVGKLAGKANEMSQGTVLGTEIGGPKPGFDQHMRGSGTDADLETNGIKQTSIAQRRLGEGRYKTQTPMSDADVKMRINEDVQGIRSMNEVRKLNDISQRMDAMEKANPRTYQNDPEYQKLSQQFETQHKVVREDKVAIDRMNALQGETGTNLRKHYNKADMEYENKVLQYRNESISESTGLKSHEIGDFHATSNKIEQKYAGGPASHDLDTSPNQKVYSGTGKNQSVDFSQTDGDHHLARAVYKAEHGRFPQTAAEYDEALRLKQVRDFTNVSTRPSDTHETYHNPDAYVGSGKGEVEKVLNPQKYGTPDKGTGVFNEQTAIHKQGTPLERHQQQYAEAQKLREQLKTNSNLSAAEKTEMGRKIADLEKQSASNHYESTRTTAKEAKIIKGINDANVKNGLEGGMSNDAKQIGDWANKVKEGKMDNATYKKLVTEKYGSEEAAQKIVAKGFRDTNK